MTPKKEKQPLRPIKKSLDSKKFHLALFEKFMPLYYEHFEVAGSCSFSKDPIPSASLKQSIPNRDNEISSSCLPSVDDSFLTNPSTIDTKSLTKSLCELQEMCMTLERKLEIVDFLKSHPDLIKVQAPSSPLVNGENKQFTPLVNEANLSEDEWNCFKI